MSEYTYVSFMKSEFAAFYVVEDICLNLGRLNMDNRISAVHIAQMLQTCMCVYTNSRESQIDILRKLPRPVKFTFSVQLRAF